MSKLLELKKSGTVQIELTRELDQLILDIKSLDSKSSEYSRLCLVMAKKLSQMPNQ